MADFEIRPDEQLDLNVRLDYAAPDAGLSYEIPRSMQRYASVDPVTGMVTPKGKPAVVLVVVKNQAGVVIDRIVIAIISSQQYTFEAEDHHVTRDDGPIIGYYP